jgi:hypothetical protein
MSDWIESKRKYEEDLQKVKNRVLREVMRCSESHISPEQLFKQCLPWKESLVRSAIWQLNESGHLEFFNGFHVRPSSKVATMLTSEYAMGYADGWEDCEENTLERASVHKTFFQVFIGKGDYAIDSIVREVFKVRDESSTGAVVLKHEDYIRLVESQTKVPEHIFKLWDALQEKKPSNATGVYITSHGITYGSRTNREAAPDNYFFFEEYGYE